MRFQKVCFLLFTSLLFVGCSSPESKTIKVMTWNIWHGGLHGTPADGFKKIQSILLIFTKSFKNKHPTY